MKTEINSVEMIENLKLIRDSYNVPAKLNGKIKYMGRDAKIVGAKGKMLAIKFKRVNDIIFVNPIWKIKYED